jgi:hypothetical protein
MAVMTTLRKKSEPTIVIAIETAVAIAARASG